MDKYFIINNRCVCTDSTPLIADNGDYTAAFAVDEEWMGRDITARFLLPDGSYCDAVLSDSLTCLIPPEVLNSSDVRVGLYSDEMATMPCRVQVYSSIKTGANPQDVQPIQEIQPYTSTFAGVGHLATSGKMFMDLQGNGSIAFEFEGTGVLLQIKPTNANVYYTVYSADECELASYNYNGLTMLYARSLSGGSARVVKTKYVNYKPGTEEERNRVIEDGITGLEYGRYLLIASKTTGTEDAHIIGAKVLTEEAKESENET